MRRRKARPAVEGDSGLSGAQRLTCLVVRVFSRHYISRFTTSKPYRCVPLVWGVFSPLSSAWLRYPRSCSRRPIRLGPTPPAWVSTSASALLHLPSRSLPSCVLPGQLHLGCLPVRARWPGTAPSQLPWIPPDRNAAPASGRWCSTVSQSPSLKLG